MKENEYSLPGIGAIGGAMAGSLIGLLLGPIGAIVGAILGFILGDEFEYRRLSSGTEDRISKEEPSYETAFSELVKDAMESEGDGGTQKRAVVTAKDSEESKDNDIIESESDEREFDSPQIKVVGCGGSGNNTINRLYDLGVEGAETIAINTDRDHLEMIEADTKILVGKTLTQGLGAGGDPSMGERAAENSSETIAEELEGADLVFITAGLGGGTGTGAAPVVSKIAKEQGAIVVGMVSTPFNVERARTVKAQEGLEKLQKETDTLVVIDNNRLLDYVPNLPIGKAFSVMDQIIAESIIGIVETLCQPSLINLDYADMTSILNQGGVAVMLVGETQDKNRTDEVVNDAMNHPLLDVDYRGASGGLVHITGGPDLTLREAEGIAQNITERLEASANVIWGARIQDDYKGKVRVMAIMTGVQSAQILGPSSERVNDRSKFGDIDLPRGFNEDVADSGDFGPI